MTNRRVQFDFEIAFSNGGGLQGQGFRLDIEGDDISEEALADYIVRDMRLLMVGAVRILNKTIITEAHKRPKPAAAPARLVDLSHDVEDGMITYRGLPPPDPHLPPEELRRRGADPVETLEALLTLADVVTCHAPLNAETHQLIDARQLRLMKPGAILVNTSRGRVVDERALYEALKSGELRAAGLDVFEEEPPSPDNPLFTLDNVVCTPHVAGVSEEADRAIAREVAEEILRVLRGERPESLACSSAPTPAS